MKSEIKGNSEERIKKATELLQKFWWFSFYLVISPLAIGFVSFWIFRVFQLGNYFALSLSVITFMFAFLFFLKSYDKYREKSFFLNKENNLKARIHITFLISLLSFVVTPIFILISPEDVSFELLPLISFSLLYNIVYYYYNYKPIAFFEVAGREFKHGIDFKLTAKQPYNFIILINYIIHIIFLALTSRTNLSWIFALITNAILYLVTLVNTRKITSNINESIRANRPVLLDLTAFKQKFTISIVSLVFILLIQLPLINIITFSISGVQYTSLEFINNSFLTTILSFFYLKSLFYVNYYYSNRINVYIDSIRISSPNEISSVKSIKYQQYNSFLSGILVVLITAFSFLIGLPIIVIIIVPFFLIVAYSEKKAGICPKNHIKYIYLLNSLAFLVSISFGVLSSLQLNYQIIIILLASYFVLEIFVRNDYFSKENVRIIQHVLAILSFTIIIYSFFEYTTFENWPIFELALYSADPIIVFISNFLINGLLISIVFLLSFYVYYTRYLSQKTSRLFRSLLMINAFLIELFIFLLINFRTFFIIDIILFSSLLFPSILLFFVFINYLLGVFSKDYFSKLTYYLFWILIGDAFLSILLVFLNNYVVITLDFLILSFFSQVNLKYGLKIEKVKESFIKRFIKVNSYIMTIELVALFFLFFYSITLKAFTLPDRIILSSYFSFIIMTFLANILSQNEFLFSHSITNKMNIILLFSSSGLAFYYPFILNFGNYFMFLLPFISLFITLYLPSFYMYRKKIYQNFIKKALLVNSALLAVLISLIPTVISLEFYRIGQSINIFIIINYTLLIIPFISLFFITFDYFIKLLSREQYITLSYYLVWILTINIFIIILISAIPNLVYITLSFLFLSISSQLNFKFGLRIAKVNEPFVKKYTIVNSYFMTIEFIMLFFFFFYLIALKAFTLSDRIILSSYFSFVIMTILANGLSRNEIVFSRSITNKINIILLFSTSGLVFYYPFLFTFRSVYVFILPLMSLAISLYLPYYYLMRKRIYEDVIKKALLVNSILLVVLLTLIPTCINVEFYRLGQPINIVHTLNYTLLIFPFSCLFFSVLNYAIKLLSPKQFFVLSYYSMWVLIFDLFIVITISSIPNLVYVTLGLLFLSSSSQLNLRFGVKIAKIKEEIVKKYFNINSYIICGELFALSFFFFFTMILFDILFSLYISTLIITILVNILSRKEVIFSKSLMNRINIVALSFTSGLVYYYLLLFTLGTYYVILIPSLCLFSLLFFPIYYMLKIGMLKKHIHNLLLIDCILIAIFLTLIPTFVSLELFRLGNSVDIMSTLNFTLYIAFGILTFTYFLFKKYNLKERHINGILKSQILIELGIAGTTIFYYTYILLFGTFFRFIIPLIAASLFLYLPSVFSYKKQYFKEPLVKKSLMANSILLSVLISSIPTITGLEFIRLGLEVNIYIIIASSLILIFLALKFLTAIGKWYIIKEKWMKTITLMQLFTWFSLSLFVGFVIISYIIIDISISISIFVFFILNIFSLRILLSYSRELKIIYFLEEVLLFGLVFSFSLVITSIIKISGILMALPVSMRSLNILWYIGLFSLVFVPLFRFISSQVRITYVKANNTIGFGSWLMLKIIMCLLTSVIFSYSILALIVSFSLTFTFFTPVTLSYFKQLEIFSEKNQLIIKNFMLGIFILSTFTLLYDLSFLFIPNEGILYISFIFVNLLLYLYFTFLRFNTILAEESTIQIFGFYLASFLLFINLLFIYRILYVVPVLCVLILILYKRSLNVIFRFCSYFLLSYVIFIDLLTIFSDIGILGGSSLILFGFLSSVYIFTFSSILVLSIWFNLKRNNNLEKLILYCLFSLMSFILLNTYSNILLLYNITISMFIFLFFIGIYFYRQENELYKWFIKPCVLLLVFDFISFISYSALFNNPTYINFNPILTFTLTMSLTGFTFILLYNNAPARFRKISFYFILFAIILSFPLFLYFLIISSFPGLIGDPVPIIIVINVGVFLYYLSVGIYQWKVSWAIWKSGWYVWNILPIVNFWIIYRSLRGVDILTESIELFGVFELKGSSILALIICSLFFLPVLYSKIRKYFMKIILIVWGESLFLLYWISQNLFIQDTGLRNLSFILFSVFLLMPFLIGLKYWKLVSIFWLGLMGINITFLFFYLSLIGLPLDMTISINILVTGLFLIVYSFFPNIRSIGAVLITGYFILLSGIFLVIYFLIYSIILDPLVSINISFIVMGFSLFSSKPLKLTSKLIDQVLSWVLIINFSWITFNTFNLLPDLAVFAFFFAMTVFGSSFFIFNRYKMKFRINKAFPFLIVAIGASASISTLFSILFNLSIYNEISIFSGFFTIFLYFLVIEYRYYLWALIPIPFTLPILGLLVSIPLIQSIWLLGFLSFSTIYLFFFQIFTNLFKSRERKDTEEVKNSIMRIYEDKNQFALLNLTCFLLNSVFISLLISILVPLSNDRFLFEGIIYVYQILDFLVIWPIFVLVSLKYIEKSEFDLKIRDPLLQFNRICFVLYLIIPTALSSNILLFMFHSEMDFIMTFFIFLLSLSGIIFLESFIIDKWIFYYLFNSIRNKFIFWSWTVFCNVLSLFFFLFYPNPFLLLFLISLINQISLYFLSYLDIPKEKISNWRIILFYTLFISGSFYLGSLISEGMVNFLEELRGITYYTLLFQNSFLIIFILSIILVKIDTRLKYSIETIIFTVFQSLFALNWIIFFNLLNILNFFSIVLIITIETCLFFKTAKYLNALFFETKKPKFLLRMFSLLIILLYFEISSLFYGLMFEIAHAGFIESILISQLSFFALTLLDIYSVKKIKRGFAQLIHTFSFFVISLMILLILNSFVTRYQFLLSLEALIFIIMQFYTNYSFFTSLKQFNEERMDMIKKWRSNLNHVLGIGIYTDLCFILLQVLFSVNAELQLILLSLGLLIHFLMIIDISLMKFLGRMANYFRVISWVFIMIFTTTYLIWLYIDYFIAFLFTSIPLIVFILIIETSYLFRLLIFWDFIISNKKKIKSSLLLISYLNFISWPMYFARMEPIYLLNLMIISLVIMFFFTYIDKYLGVLKEKLLKTVRKTSFSIVGLLLSINSFISLSSLPNSTLPLNLSVSLFIFVVFLGIIVKPFKGHSLKAFSFWAAIFSLLSIIVSELSQIWQVLPVLIPLALLIYPFVFLLEELREFFNNFVEILRKFIKKIEMLIINAFKALFKFIKTYFKIIWILFSASVAIFFGVLLSELFYNILLGPIHPTLLTIAIFAFLILVVPSSKSSDPDIIFKRRVLRLSYGWGSVISFLFIYITPVWYIFTIFISIAVAGSIILIFIRRKEEREKISVKWRFYTLLSLFVLLIIFGILFSIQLLTLNI